MSAPDVYIPLGDRQVLSVEQAACFLGVHRVTVYGLLRTGRLSSVKIGRRRLITRSAINDLLATSLECAGHLPR